MGVLGDSLARFLALPLARGAGTVAGGGGYTVNYFDWRTFYNALGLFVTDSGSRSASLGVRWGQK